MRQDQAYAIVKHRDPELEPPHVPFPVSQRMLRQNILREKLKDKRDAGIARKAWGVNMP